MTWSFTDSKINKLFKEKDENTNYKSISSDLNVLNSIFPNLIFYLKENLDRGFKDISLFEIRPALKEKSGDQLTVIGAVRAGKVSRLSWNDKEIVDTFDVKKDVIQSLCEAGINKDDIIIDDKTPSYYHPGKSGSVYQNKNEKALAYFGEIHPNIIKKLDIKTEGLVLFEICIDYIKSKLKIKDSKSEYKFSDFKIQRDFAFIINKNFKSQKLVNIIKSVDNKLIKSVRVFDVFEGENIPEGKNL